MTEQQLRQLFPRASDDFIRGNLETPVISSEFSKHDAGTSKTSWRSGWRIVGGKRFYARSRWEANYARYLEFQKQHGLITEWEHEPETFWFLAIKRGARSYLPDFRVTMQGKIEYHEVKGWMDRRSKTKLSRMKKYHPEVIVVVRDSNWYQANKSRLRSIVPGWESGN